MTRMPLVIFRNVSSPFTYNTLNVLPVVKVDLLRFLAKNTTYLYIFLAKNTNIEVQNKRRGQKTEEKMKIFIVDLGNDQNRLSVIYNEGIEGGNHDEEDNPGYIPLYSDILIFLVSSGDRKR